MKATIIRIAVKDGTWELPGWIVPDTDDLFGIDQRIEADIEWAPPQPACWYITHLPSGFRVKASPYTDAATRAMAVEVAQRFYREAKARDWDLYTTVPARVGAKYKEMSTGDQRAFWYTVAGWGQKEDDAA